MRDLSTIRVGDALPQRSHTPGNVELFLYNAAIWNAHRIHFDWQYATQEEGYPGIVIDGPLQGDWLTQVVTEWLGDSGEFESFEFSNRKASYVGETLVAGGRVSALDAEQGRVTLELELRNEQDQVVTPGRAIVRLRSTSSPAGCSGR